MGRKKKHEEHVNHEAWAIPYADLLTLLLAFFVVMYAVSSLNEGKYRVMADALTTAFGGMPRTISQVQVGNQQVARPAAFKTERKIAHQFAAGPYAAAAEDTAVVFQDDVRV